MSNCFITNVISLGTCYYVRQRFIVYQDKTTIRLYFNLVAVCENKSNIFGELVPGDWMKNNTKAFRTFGTFFLYKTEVPQTKF